MKTFILTETELHNMIKSIILENNSSYETYYHGGDKNDDLFYNGQAWLVDDPFYSYQYAKDKENPVIWEITINENNLNIASLYDFPEYFEYYDCYDELDDETKEYLKEGGYNAYQFPIEWDGYDYECLVLLDNSSIESIKEISPEKYQELKKEDEEE